MSMFGKIGYWFGKFDYSVRRATGSKMGAFFVYLVVATVALLAFLWLLQSNDYGVFAPLNDESEKVSQAQVNTEAGEKIIENTQKDTEAASKSLGHQRVNDGNPAVNIQGVTSSSKNEKKKADNGFSWGNVNNTTNSAWVSFWSLLLTIPITAISAIFAIRIATRAEELSEGERPEYEEAFNAAQAYAVFKSLTVTLPALMRQAQRDGLFEGNGGLVEKINETIAEAQKALQQSSVPILLGSVAEKAWKKRLTVKDSVYMGMLHSTLLYSALRQKLDTQAGSEKNADDKSKKILNDFMRWVNQAYEYVSNVDSLIAIVEKGLLPKSVKTPADMKYVKLTSDTYSSNKSAEQNTADTNLFSEMEFWFIRHVSPIAGLNNELRLKDISRYRETVFGDVTKNFNIHASLSELSVLKDFVTKQGSINSIKPIVFCASDSGCFDIAELIKEATGKWVRILVDEIPRKNDIAENKDDLFLCQVTLNHDTAIVNISDLIASFGDKADELSTRIILLLDQGDQYRDLNKPGLSNYLRFSQICFIALQVHNYAGMSENQDWKDGAHQRFSNFAVNLESELGLKSRRQIDLEWKKHHPEYQFHCAAVLLDSATEIGDGKPYLDSLYRILDALAALRSNNTSPSESIDRVVEACKDCPPEFARLLEYLAKRPLIDRPVVGFEDNLKGARTIDLDLRNAGMVVTAYLNSESYVNRSPLINLMLDGIWRKEIDSDEKAYKKTNAFISISTMN